MMVISLDFIFLRPWDFPWTLTRSCQVMTDPKVIIFQNNWYSFNCIVNILLNINELQNYISSFWEVSHMNQLLLPTQNLIFHYHTHVYTHTDTRTHTYTHIHKHVLTYTHIIWSMIHSIIMKNIIHANVKE